jgi:hypothetical protein
MEWAVRILVKHELNFLAYFRILQIDMRLLYQCPFVPMPLIISVPITFVPMAHFPKKKKKHVELLGEEEAIFWAFGSCVMWVH